MNFKFRQVEIFWAVMTTGSATAAAEMLHTSQPTVSRELALFERTTQLELFRRQAGKLVPTEHGLMLFEEVKRNYAGLERIKNAVERIRNFQQSGLQLTCLPAFSVALLPSVCKRFRQYYPQASISITPLESPVLEEAVSTQQYHMGISEHSMQPPGTQTEVLMKLDLVCVLPEEHPLACKAVLIPDDFLAKDVISLAASDPYRIRVDTLFNQLGIERNLVIETDSASAVCASVCLGEGIAVVNPLTALHYVGQGLIIRPFSEQIVFSVCLIRPLHRPYSSETEYFIRVLREYCEQVSTQLESLCSSRGKSVAGSD